MILKSLHQLEQFSSQIFLASRRKAGVVAKSPDRNRDMVMLQHQLR